MDYLDAVRDLILGELRGRPLSVIRVRVGQQPFMQKNVPGYAPPWIRTVTLWAGSSRREVRYALCDDWRTLLWFANQRAVEYHPALALAGQPDRPSYLVLDIDPPPGGPFGQAVAAARLVRQALADVGLSGAVKTSGSPGPGAVPNSLDQPEPQRSLSSGQAGGGRSTAVVTVGAGTTRSASRPCSTRVRPGSPGSS